MTNIDPRRRAKLRNCRGLAIVNTLAISVPLIIAGGTMLQIVVSHQREVEQRIGEETSEFIANSGAHDALSTLQRDNDFTGSYQLPIDGGVAVVDVSKWSEDDLDNDNNGLIDDATEADITSILSTGWFDVTLDRDGNPIEQVGRSHRHAVEVLLQKDEPVVAYNQAVYIDDPLADLTINGTSFRIDGNDTNLDGTKGPDPARYAIGTPGNPSFLQLQVKPSQRDKIVGLGAKPSIGRVDDCYLDTELEQMASQASLIWNQPSATYSGDIGNRTTMTPAIAYASGNLRIHGKTQGVGTILVRGDLEIEGAFDFIGVILVGGSLTIRGGGGSKNVRGALLTLGAVKSTDIEISGGIDIRYSSQGIQLANSSLGSYRVVSWMDH